MYKNGNLHMFNMFNRTYAFDYNTNFVFSIDELSRKILEGELLQSDYDKYDTNLIRGRQGLVKLLSNINILSSKNTYNNIVKKNGDLSLSAINLFLTNNCNLRCEYCFEQNKFKPVDMSKDIIRKSIDFLYRNSDKGKIPTVFFFGGEPLLKIDLIKYVDKYINNYKETFKCDYGITTNGTILDDDIYNLLNDMNVRIMLSLDGSKDKQDLQRKFKNGNGSYDVVKKNVDTYFKSELNKLNVRNTITKQDIDYLNVYRFFKYNDFKNLTSIPVSSTDVNVRLDKEDIKIIIENSIKVASEALDDILNENETLRTNFFYKAKLYPINTSNNYCGAGIKSVAIDTKGDIFTCHRFVGDDNFKFGNIMDMDIDNKIHNYQIFYKDRFKNLKSCNECWAFNLCNGGCMHENLTEGGDINNTQHNLCDLRRSWFEISIAMYAMICEKNPTLLKNIYGNYVFENYINRWFPLNIS